MKSLIRVIVVAALASLGCGSGSGSGGTGGAVGTGGATGGSTGTGGSGTGGTTGSGGTTATGGAAGSVASGTGGSSAAGAPGTGGSTSGGGHGGAGGSGTTGGGGTAGAASGPVTPTQESGANNNLYRLAFGDVVMEIDASTGGRVSSLSLSGTDLMVPPASDATTWGSVFWPSPRSAWTPDTWPPPAAIDNDPYTAMISGNDLILTGMTDSSMGIGMVKDYSADASGWITINYTIKSTKGQKEAPWEVTRVQRGGMVFFPTSSSSSVMAGPLTVTQSNGIVWFDDSSKTATSTNGAKLIADGAMGWDAYVLGSNLFLKKFTDTPASAAAPGEGEICIYPGATWIEYEVEGPYTQIAANGTLPWKMQWKVVKIPSSVTIAVGSSSLVTFAEQQAAM
ncbi:MAG TPA: hypothetical protein VMT03_04640 [Polyangia bacterium]|nr:hypothetical protein [Polyangia bacterium]